MDGRRKSLARFCATMFMVKGKETTSIMRQNFGGQGLSVYKTAHFIPQLLEEVHHVYVSGSFRGGKSCRRSSFIGRLVDESDV